MAFGVVAGFFGIVHSHDSKIRAEEQAKWKPQLEACTANEKTARDANAQLQTDFAAFKSAHVEQDKGVAALDQRTKAAQELVRKMLLDAEGKRQKAERELAALRSKQASTVIDKNATCDQKLGATSKALDEAVKARLGVK